VLKKINRLKSKKDFADIKSMGVLYHSPIFSMVVLNSAEDNVKKFGFIISKKIAKEAVVRNKIKRYLSQAVYDNLENFKLGIKAVFLVKRSILDKKIEEINQEIIEIAKKI
jgi:ribonuclease P protein component